MTVVKIIHCLLGFLLCVNVFAQAGDSMQERYTIRLVTGKDLIHLIDFIAQQRVEFYKGYPYLYDGTLEGQRQELTWYFSVPGVVAAVTYFGDVPVAYASGTPLTPYMQRHFAEFAHVCKSNDIDPNEHFHIVDVVVLPEYRGHNLVRRMFEKLESYAQDLGFASISLSSESHEHHPLKPKNYRNTDSMWQKLGYTKTDMFIHFSWETIQLSGPSKMEKHAMSYWMKQLNATDVEKNNYHVDILRGDDMKHMLDFVAQQRIRHYKGYPYLYEGNMQEELEYLNLVASSSHSALCVVYKDDHIASFAMGASFVEFASHFKGSIELFEAESRSPHDYYYIADDIVLPGHEGHLLTERMFEQLEQYVRNLGFAYTCIVHEQYDVHPLKPKDYQDFDWSKLGYAKTESAICFTWNTLQSDGSSCKQEHVLPYWVKKLN